MAFGRRQKYSIFVVPEADFNLYNANWGYPGWFKWGGKKYLDELGPWGQLFVQHPDEQI